ncbi:hypothetical protein LTR09_006093 [Extremus antarcticus]|uniref:Uncharacterized protein n=1 Tax=Extremus antarcticus TaxID=702011 RepID=A0AAJ0DFE7_9PEZI|nr:hypothetical protein LTR09_006093 [Extremus antarcticus]
MPYSIIGKINSRSRLSSRPPAVRLTFGGQTIKYAVTMGSRVFVRCPVGIVCVGYLGPNSLISRKSLVVYGVQTSMWGGVIQQWVFGMRFNRERSVVGVWLSRKEHKSLMRRLVARNRRRNGFRPFGQTGQHWNDITTSSGLPLAVVQRALLS